MTQPQLAKIWLCISLFLLYFALNSWVVSLGGQEIFDAKLVLPTRVPAAFIGIPICSVTMMAWAIVGTTYARRSHKGWHRRIPVAFFEEIETDSCEGKIYQATTFFLVLLVALGALVHFWDVVNDAAVLTTDMPVRSVGLWDWGAFSSWNDPARICTGVDPKDGHCEGGCTVLPGLEPGLFALLTAGTVALLLVNMFAIFLPRTKTSVLH